MSFLFEYYKKILAILVKHEPQIDKVGILFFALPFFFIISLEIPKNHVIKS